MADLYSFRKKEIKKKDSVYWRMLSSEMNKKKMTKKQANEIWNRFKINKDSFVRGVQLKIPDKQDDNY